MHIFSVTIRTEIQQLTYTAIGRSAIDVHLEALNQFGICAVSVKPIKVPA